MSLADKMRWEKGSYSHSGTDAPPFSDSNRYYFLIQEEVLGMIDEFYDDISEAIHNAIEVAERHIEDIERLEYEMQELRAENQTI